VRPGDDFDRAVRIALLIVLLGIVLLCCLGLVLALVLTSHLLRDPLE
jgi:hypothetical protein